jgi:hypothetical protein
MRGNKETKAELALEREDEVLAEQWNLQKKLKNYARQARNEWRQKKHRRLQSSNKKRESSCLYFRVYHCLCMCVLSLVPLATEASCF